MIEDKTLVWISWLSISNEEEITDSQAIILIENIAGYLVLHHGRNVQVNWINHIG